MNATRKTPRAISAVCALFLIGAVCTGGYAGLRVVEWSYRDSFSTVRVDTIRNPTGVVVIPLDKEVVVEQRFKAMMDGLTAVQVMTVNWGKVPAAYPCEWSLHDAESTEGDALRSGVFRADRASDWQHLKLEFASIPDSEDRTYLLRIKPRDAQGNLVGLPTFTPEFPGHSVRAYSPEGLSSAGGGGANTLDLRLEFQKGLAKRPAGDRETRG
jgi:hypothetical protein